MQPKPLPGRLLVTGAEGFVGKSALTLMPESTLGLGRASLDITNVGQVGATLDRLAPWGVLNCAAQASVDGADSDPEAARVLNGKAPGILARACRERGIRFCHLSTDYVFGEREDVVYGPRSAPCPVNVYGHTKAEGEAQVLSANPDALVVRIAWVFGAYSRGSGGLLLRGLLAGQTVNAIADRFGHPTYVNDALERCRSLMLDPDARGIHHAVNAGTTSWLIFALRLAERLGISVENVHAISRRSLPPGARRPTRVAMEVDPRASGSTLEPMRSWESAQDAFLLDLLRAGLKAEGPTARAG